MRLFYLTILSLFIGISVANAQSENITPIAQKINTLLQLNDGMGNFGEQQIITTNADYAV